MLFKKAGQTRSARQPVMDQYHLLPRDREAPPIAKQSANRRLREILRVMFHLATRLNFPRGRNRLPQRNVRHGRREHYPNPLTVDGKLSNITDVNFISSSGDDSYVITYAGMASGMTVGQHMVSRTSRDPKDNKTVGFHVDYKDEKDVVDSTTGQKKDRMFISAYDNEATSAGALTVMRSTDPGFVGINDIVGQSEIILPETIFNIQSTGDAVTRVTSLNSSHKASIQLLNPENELREGFEIEYSQSTARADMSMFKNMDKKTVISIHRDPKEILCC